MSQNPAEQPSATPAQFAAATTVPRDVKIILAVLVFMSFVMMLNETSLTVALPAIMADYLISAATAQWLLTGFMLTMAIVMPATGWVLDRFTTRSVFLFASITFLAGTVIAAIAPLFSVLLVARVLQAVGLAILMPLLMTVAMTLVPPARRGTVMGIIAVVMAAGPAIGPAIGGLVLGITSWHGIFWVMVPMLIIGTVLGLLTLTNVGKRRDTRFDLISLILSIFAFGGVVYGLSSLGLIIEGGTAGTAALIIAGVGALGLALFIWRQLHQAKRDQAFLDLRPLKVRNFSLSIIVMICVFGVLLGVSSLLPLYLQGALLVTALVSGMVILPGGLLEAVLSPFVGRLYDRFGPRPLIIPGMATLVASLVWLATADDTSSVGEAIAIYIIFSIGVAMVLTPLLTTALGSLPLDLYGHGSAILNTVQQLAAAAATATMITVYSRGTAAAEAAGIDTPAATADGAQSAFIISVVVTGVALIMSFFITRVPIRASEIEPDTPKGEESAA